MLEKLDVVNTNGIGMMNVMNVSNEINRRRSARDPLFKADNSDRCDLSKRLIVNSCGMESFIHLKRDNASNRPAGRTDYQIVYTKGGSLRYCENNRWNICNENTFLVFKPHEPQIYYYSMNEKASCYWIHFTGYDAGEILRYHGLEKRVNHLTSEPPHLSSFISKIIDEFLNPSENYQYVCACYLESFILNLGLALSKENIQKEKKNASISVIIKEMQETYWKNLPIEYYAAISGFSVNHFIKLFKEYTNQSPHNYLTELKIRKAENLILESEMSIGDIARKVGYDDPLYFSRVFKKYRGYSPSSLRKN